LWPTVGLQRDGLAVQDCRQGGEGERGLDQFGNAVGDVVQAARENPDILARAVHLDARAIQLPLDCRRRHARQGGFDAGSRLSQHGLQRLAQAQGKLAQAGWSVAQRRLGDRAQVARQHARAP
jgi:hypothetical protein